MNCQFILFYDLTLEKETEWHKKHSARREVIHNNGNIEQPRSQIIFFEYSREKEMTPSVFSSRPDVDIILKWIVVKF